MFEEQIDVFLALDNDPAQVEATIENGTVRLGGELRSRESVEALERVVAQTPGVVEGRFVAELGRERREVATEVTPGSPAPPDLGNSSGSRSAVRRPTLRTRPSRRSWRQAAARNANRGSHRCPADRPDGRSGQERKEER